MELEVKKIIGSVLLLLTGNNMCQQNVSFLKNKTNKQTKNVRCGGYINYLKNAPDKSIVHQFADDSNPSFVNRYPSEISRVIVNELKLQID